MKVVKLAAAIAFALLGIVMIFIGEPWGDAIFNNMPETEIYVWMSLAVPFIPLLLMGIGASLYIRANRSPD